MSAIESIKAHYRSKLAGGLGSVDVPEWGTETEPLRIWFKSATNPKTQEKLAKLFNESKPIEAAVEALIIRALNEDGTAMFVPANRRELMNHCDVDILIRVIGEINNFQQVDQDEVLGN
tara:strand:+ start:132 stop:488 length:357 start_codon:yes stop_codon:yes gene_type:complete